MISLFYRLMYVLYDQVYGRQYMLHYPLYRGDNQDLMQGQIYFIDYCLQRVEPLKGRRVLDVGCGNGVQTIYIHEQYGPAHTCGIDIDPRHVSIARAEATRRGLEEITFVVDDAQRLESVPAGSADVALCIESAHHYADKSAFLAQTWRALRPGGVLLIADLILRKEGLPSWINRRMALNYWSQSRYGVALPEVGFEVVSAEDLTPYLIAGFGTSGRWFENPEGRKSVGYQISKAVGQALAWLYLRQLNCKLDYCLLLARKVQNA